EEPFHSFEAAVLPLLAKYRGELLLRLRPSESSLIGGSAEMPYELHVVRFETEADLANYSADDERQRHLQLKDESVRRTLTIKGELV
ncbi:MAG TPA: hypothetical protein VGP93_11960, partial [Polyangiaceae bacterium]|nr:hypothetical protein [Polyangiaceae bacterium]